MRRTTILQCYECLLPIAAGEHFVCFKVPGSAAYRFFHCRYHAADCWERALKTVIDASGSQESTAFVSGPAASRLVRRS